MRFDRFVQKWKKTGDVISYVRDETIKAVIVDDKHVEYDGETLSLTALAAKLMGVTHAVQGPIHFCYNGKVLNDLRTELEGK